MLKVAAEEPVAQCGHMSSNRVLALVQEAMWPMAVCSLPCQEWGEGNVALRERVMCHPAKGQGWLVEAQAMPSRAGVA